MRYLAMFTGHRVRPRRYEDAAIVLAGLGIVCLFIAYLALVFTLAGLVTLTAPVWLRHQPRTRWSYLALALIVVGLVLQVYYLLTAPI